MSTEDDKIELVSKEVNTFEIEKNSLEMQINTTDALMWSYGINWTRDQIIDWFEDLSGYKLS